MFWLHREVGSNSEGRSEVKQICRLERNVILQSSDCGKTEIPIHQVVPMTRAKHSVDTDLITCKKL